MHLRFEQKFNTYFKPRGSGDGGAADFPDAAGGAADFPEAAIRAAKGPACLHKSESVKLGL